MYIFLSKRNGRDGKTNLHIFVWTGATSFPTGKPSVATSDLQPS